MITQIRAFTLIELLVVVAILALLASLLMPVITGVRRQSLMSVDANNCKQLLGTVLAYRESFGGDWPRPAYITLDAERVPSRTGYDATAASFYALAFTMDMAPKSFISPAAVVPDVRMTTLKDPQNEATVADVAAWAPWGTGYALDWSTPIVAGNARAVMTSRDPILFGQAEANVVFNDSHVEALPFGVDDANDAVSAGIVVPDTDDDIWTSDGDGSEIDHWGRGNRKRAFMR